MASQIIKAVLGRRRGSAKRSTKKSGKKSTHKRGRGGKRGPTRKGARRGTRKGGARRGPMRKNQIKFGIGGDFNFRHSAPQEAITVAPGAYATMVANAQTMSAERPCFHKALGLQGVRFTGSQWCFATIQPTIDPTSGVGNVVDGSTFAGAMFMQGGNLAGVSAAFGVPMNPWNLGGQLGLRAFKYQRYRFNNFGLRFVSSTGVTTPGSLTFGYFKDFAQADKIFLASAITFAQAADLVPSLTTPVIVPQAVFNVPYTGNELYYVGYNSGRPNAGGDPLAGFWGDAQNRQEVQGCAVVVSDYITTATLGIQKTGSVYLDYDIEFYDPLPSENIIPSTSEEVVAVHEVLQYLRGGVDNPPTALSRYNADRPERVAALDKLMGTKPAQHLGSLPWSLSAAVPTSESRHARTAPWTSEKLRDDADAQPGASIASPAFSAAASASSPDLDAMRIQQIVRELQASRGVVRSVSN
jgi:hypothetical protein